MFKRSILMLSLLTVGSSMFGADTAVLEKKIEALEKKLKDVVVTRVVHGQRVVGMLEESKKLEGELMSERKKWEDKVKVLAQKLQKKATEFDAKSKTAKPEVLNNIKEDIEKLKREGKNIEQEAEAVLKGKFEKGLAKINKKVKEKIDQLAEGNGWDIVVMQEAGVVYTSKMADITQLVIDEMNAEHKKTNKK